MTYIQTYIDPTWTLLLTTPNFPDYPFGHSVQSGAVAVQLTTLFGAVGFTDNTHADLGYKPRSFATWSAAADEAADWNSMPMPLRYAGAPPFRPRWDPLCQPHRILPRHCRS